MSKKIISKKNGNGQKDKKEVAVIGISKFAIMKPNVDIKAVIEANLGGETISALDLERVKIPGGGGTTWTVPKFGGVDEIKELDVLIILHTSNRTYWETEFGQGEPGPPDCYSGDCVTGFIRADFVPSEGHMSPTSVCGEQTCPMAKFGTAKGGKGDGQACTQKRTLFFLRENSLLPMTLNASPASLKNAMKYLIGMTGAGMEPHHIVTRLTLQPDRTKGGVEYSKIVFTPLANSIPEAQWPEIDGYVAAISPFLKKAAREIAQDVTQDTPYEEQKAAA